jgi:hypothetical protein
MKKKQQRFFVEGKMALAVGVEITADSLESAMARAQAMKLDDFVDILGEHNDSNFRISGVFSAESLPDA